MDAEEINLLNDDAMSGERALPELCVATVAVCSFYYVRLMKERRRRECERRRRVLRFQRSRARERLQSAVLWMSQVLGSREMSAMSCAPPADWQGRGVCSGAHSSALWSAVMEKAFTHIDWTENFHMTKPTFGYLCDQLRPVIERAGTRRRPAIPTEMQLAMTLLHLGSSCEFRTIEKVFGVSGPTLREVVLDICEAVVSILTPKLISIPHGDALQNTVKRFEERYGVPQLAGVIGIFHVAIVPPSKCTGQYFNSKGWHSVLLQAVVDSDHCFWDLNIGSPGNLSHCQTLLTSELYEWGTEGSLFPNTTYYGDAMEIPIHLLAPHSYPLLPWLMTPFSEESRPEHAELNTQFSSALSVTQVAFGRLKGRWCCLVKRNDPDLSFLPTLIAACCTLHNICESRGDQFQEHWLEEATEEELEQPSGCEEDEWQPEQISMEIRDALANTVWAQNGGL